MSNQTAVPTKISPLGPIQIFVEWNDGRKFAVPYSEIRFHCPCASCVDEHTGKRTLSRDSIRADIYPKNVQPVGRYAIQIHWNDHHETGIYHFDRLLELCVNHGRPL